MTYTVRRVTRAQIAPQLPALLKDAAGYDQSDVDRLTETFAAFRGGELAGLGGLACYHGFWCLRLGVVARDHRGHGLQRALIRARVRWLRGRGVPHVNVWVDPANVYSLNNVVAEGFRFVREKPRSFHGRPHLKLRKLLKEAA